MTRVPIHPGTVDWSGENPGIYLKDSADGPWRSLLCFFRIVLSPHGRGHGLVLLEAPDLQGSRPDALNVCVTDNEPMMRWLIAEFMSHFASFRGRAALRELEYRRLTDVRASGDPRRAYSEWVEGDGVEATLSWTGLGAPFAVELPVEKSATGRHEMFSLFVEADQASGTVNGRRLPGRVFPRDFAGRESRTAFLAFSETWVRPPSAA